MPPINGVLDSMVRADENPPSDGGAWTNKVVTTDANLELVSNQCLATSAVRCGAYWNARQFADSEAFLTLPILNTVDGIGLWLRVGNPNTSSLGGYFAWYAPGSGLRIWRAANTTLTPITNYTAFTLSAGDKLWFRANGSSLVLAIFNSGVWTDKVSVTDATYSIGYIGIFGAADTTWRATDFGGGFTNVESATLKSVTTPSSNEIYNPGILDSTTVTSVTTPSSIDVLYQDSATFATVTQISIGELDFVHPTGYWGPFDTDNGII